MISNQLKPWLSSLQRITPLRFFICTAGFFGLLFILIVPPFQGADEPLHFFRAYQVSEFNLAVDSNEGNDYGGNIPKSLSDTVRLTTNNSSLGNLMPDEKYKLNTTAEARKIHENSTNRIWTNFTATATYPPIAYLPQSIGVFIARLFGVSPIGMMYAGRLTNLTAWIALIAISIKLIPRKKWAVVFVGLIPVSLTQAASLSADVMTIGSVALLVSGTLYLINRKKPISNIELMLLLVAVVSAALCKQVTITLLPFIFLIPNALFGSKIKACFYKMGFIAIPLFFYGTWMYVIRNLDMKSVFSKHQNPPEQIHHVLANPLSFVHALWNTHFYGTGDSITRSVIGTFGWGDVGLSLWIVIVGYVGLFLLLVGNHGKFEKWLSIKQRLYVTLIVIAYVVSVSAALYAYYNPVGATTIAGIQGRYLLPAILLLIPVAHSAWLSLSKAAYYRIATAVPLFLLISTMIVLHARYY